MVEIMLVIIIACGLTIWAVAMALMAMEGDND
jgi:hypothetical protein